MLLLFLDVENGSAKVRLVFIINMNALVSRFKMGIEIRIRCRMRLRKRIIGGIQFDMLTVCQTKLLTSWTINRISIEPCLPTAREGNVFTGVWLSTIDLIASWSLLILITARSARIPLECFLVLCYFSRNSNVFNSF